MNRIVQHARISRAKALVCLLVPVLWNASASYVQAQWTVVRVEEDWELTVTTADTEINAPQITCAMSPAGNDEFDFMADEADFVSFELNHQSQPSYEAGGLHVHAWNGEYVHASTHTQAGVYLEGSDVITWTQSMTLSGGTLTYAVTNGNSTTWGTFGTGELALSVSTPTSLTNLNAYRIQDSLSGSGVGWGANRVQSFVLKTLRVVTSNGYVFEFSINQDVLADNN